MVGILMMSAKLANLGLLEIKVFWNKGYDVKISVYDVTNKVLSRDWNYIVDEVLVTLVFLWGYHNLSFIRIWPEKTILLSRALGSSSIV